MCGGPLGVISIRHGFLREADGIRLLGRLTRRIGDFRTDFRFGRSSEPIQSTVTPEMSRAVDSETTETVRDEAVVDKVD